MYAEANLKYHLDVLLESTHANVYLKDTKGRYLDCNHNLAHTNKMHQDDIKGKTDFDLLWGNQAPTLIRNDTEIMSSEITKMFVEPAQFGNEPLTHYISHKSPLHSYGGKIIGVIGISFLTDYTNPMFQSAHVPELLIQKQLTLRQIDCLFYLVQGMTIKQIGHKLNLSPRTVEGHINAMKDKLSCRNRAELVAIALQMPVIREKL